MIKQTEQVVHKVLGHCIGSDGTLSLSNDNGEFVDYLNDLEDPFGVSLPDDLLEGVEHVDALMAKFEAAVEMAVMIDAVADGLDVKPVALDAQTTLVPAQYGVFHVRDPEGFIEGLNVKLGADFDSATVFDDPRSRSVAGLVALMNGAARSGDAMVDQAQVDTVVDLGASQKAFVPQKAKKKATKKKVEKKKATKKEPAKKKVKPPQLHVSAVSAWDPVSGSAGDRVRNIVAEQLGVDKDRIRTDSNFENDLGADSLDTVELVMECEEEFDINFPDDDAVHIHTVRDMLEYIEQRCG